jgi:hypothetical protein
MRRRAALRLSSLLAIILATVTSSASAQSPPPPTPSPSLITSLADQIVQLFPRVDGDVIEVQGDVVTLAVGKRDGLQPGVELDLYRQGRELHHPRTGQVLGRAEQALGRVRVTESFEAYALGKLLPGATAAAGDRARMSGGHIPITVVVMVDGTNRSLAEAATQELVESLTKSGRFRVLLGDQIAASLTQDKITAEDFLRGSRNGPIAERFKTEQLLAIHFKTVERRPFMEVRLFTPPRRDALLTTAFYVPASVRRSVDQAKFSGAGAKAPGQQRVKERSLLAKLLTGDWEPTTYSSGESSIPLKEVAKFPFVVRFMDVAVSPKDGIPRVVVSDGMKIYQYRLVNNAFEPDWTFSIPVPGTVFSVQLADLDGDGIFEVVVNRHHFSATRSMGMMGFILEQKSGRPKVWVDNVTDTMIAVDEAGGGIKRTLWTQRFSPEKFFTLGQADRVVVKDGKLVTVDAVRVADTFRATGATFSNINGKAGVRALAYIDPYQRLRLTAGQEELWSSTSAVGGGGIKLELALTYETGHRAKSIFIYTEPMPLAVDLDGDGVEEILVPQNQQAGMLAVIYKGPAGFRVQSINSGFEGTITAFGAIPGETPTLVASVVRYSNVLKTEGETQIIVTLPTD